MANWKKRGELLWVYDIYPWAIGFFPWAITKITTNYTNRTKPTSSWSNRTKPTTTWE